MRLLDVSSLRLVQFNDDRAVEGAYAILSHTWDTDPKNEVSYKDLKRDKTVDEFTRRKAKDKAGFPKVDQACRQAQNDGYKYIWIDTCCINKDSSAELSEAINSMYRWYANAGICYAYLADVSIEGVSAEAKTLKTRLSKAKWFERGWTLQELIAPAAMDFFDSDWRKIGAKSGLTDIISDITGIDRTILLNRDLLFSACIATRMSWAAKRQTTRIEDEAYSLLGIFGVNMPMIYGEGPRAFLRLQEEILRRSTDISIFAWLPWKPDTRGMLFAPGAKGFERSGKVYPAADLTGGQAFELTNKGLRISLRVSDEGDHYLASLGSVHPKYPEREICLKLRKHGTLGEAEPAMESLVCEVDRSADVHVLYTMTSDWVHRNVTIMRESITPEIKIRFLLEDDLRILSAYPLEHWTEDLGQYHLRANEMRRFSSGRVVIGKTMPNTAAGLPGTFPGGDDLNTDAATPILLFGQFLKQEGSNSTFRMRWMNTPAGTTDYEKDLRIELPSRTARYSPRGDSQYLEATAVLQAPPSDEDAVWTGDLAWIVTIKRITVEEESTSPKVRLIPRPYGDRPDTIRQRKRDAVADYAENAIDTFADSERGKRWGGWLERKVDRAEEFFDDVFD